MCVAAPSAMLIMECVIIASLHVAMLNKYGDLIATVVALHLLSSCAIPDFSKSVILSIDSFGKALLCGMPCK